VSGIVLQLTLGKTGVYGNHERMVNTEIEVKLDN
jgi:hypothetical protein